MTSIHTYIHTDMHTYTHTHTCMNTYMHAYMHTYLHRYTHTHIHTYMHTYRQTCIYTYKYTYTYRALISNSAQKHVSHMCDTCVTQDSVRNFISNSVGYRHLPERRRSPKTADFSIFFQKKFITRLW